jgi:hypothetical protein
MPLGGYGLQRQDGCENGAFFPVDRRTGGSPGSSFVHRAGMAIIGHAATCLGLFPYESMTVTDMIHSADEAVWRVNTVGNGNRSQTDTSVPEPQVVWVGTQADACFSATTDGGARR